LTAHDIPYRPADDTEVKSIVLKQLTELTQVIIQAMLQNFVRIAHRKLLEY
jgi:hypothetical protein